MSRDARNYIYIYIYAKKEMTSHDTAVFGFIDGFFNNKQTCFARTALQCKPPLHIAYCFLVTNGIGALRSVTLLVLHETSQFNFNSKCIIIIIIIIIITAAVQSLVIYFTYIVLSCDVNFLLLLIYSPGTRGGSCHSWKREGISPRSDIWRKKKRRTPVVKKVIRLITIIKL